MIRADFLADFVDLVEAHFGRAPDLQAQEVLDRCARVSFQALRHLLVVFVALGFAEMFARHLVMTQRGIPVAAYIFDRHLARAIGALVAEGPARRYRRQRLAAIHLLVGVAILGEFLRDSVPRLLRNDQDADAEFRHDARGFGRDRGSVSAALERLEGLWPDVTARLLDVLAVVFAVALLESFAGHLGGFDKALARLAERYAET